MRLHKNHHVILAEEEPEEDNANRNIESITGFGLRSETTVASLRSAGEPVSDSLLVAMVLKGLPAECKTFSAIVLQRDEKDKKMKF